MFKKLLPLLLAMAALPAGATTTFTSLNSMQSANPGLTFTNVDFSGLASYTPAGTFSSTGVDFIVNSNTLAGNANLSGWGPGMILKTANNAGTITIDLPTGATAFGGYFGFVGSGTGGVTLAWTGDDTSSLSISDQSQNTPVYWGVTSSLEFTSITLTLSEGTKFTAVNGFTFGTPVQGGGGGAEAPEPSTMALLGSALIAFPLLTRRIRRTRSSLRPAEVP